MFRRYFWYLSAKIPGEIESQRKKTLEETTKEPEEKFLTILQEKFIEKLLGDFLNEFLSEL